MVISYAYTMWVNNMNMYTELLALCTESSRIHHKDIISVQKTF